MESRQPLCSIYAWCVLQGNFNKLKAMQKLLNDTEAGVPEGVGWLWWLDIDTVIADPLQACFMSDL